MHITQNTTVIFTVDSGTTGKKIHMNNATFVPENACHHFTCRRNCSKFFWWWWIRLLPLLWCSFCFRSEMMYPGFVTCSDEIQKILAFRSFNSVQPSTLLCRSKAENCLGTQRALTFRKCKCSWMIVFTVPTERFVSCAISRQVMRRLSRIRRSTRWMFAGMTALGWEPPRPGSSLTEVRPSLKSLHHLTFRHRASCILGQAFHYSPENAFYIFNQQIYFIIWYLFDRASLI